MMSLLSVDRKRRRGTKFDASEEEREKESEVTVEDEQKNLATEIKEKERIDNLWASFKHETESSTKLKSTGKVPHFLLLFVIAVCKKGEEREGNVF